MQHGDEMPIIVWAAKNYFWSMGKHELKTLASELDVDATSPTLYGYLKVLINTILPEASEDEVDAILLLRSVVEDDPMQQIDLNVLEALFPGADLKVVEDNVELFACRML